jgi:Tfp pilus assembly protein PilF
VNQLGEGALPLAGKRVGFAGRLLSCDRSLAGRLVLRAGGSVARGSRDLDLLVVGNGGDRARRAAARTLTEAEFLDLVGHSPKAVRDPLEIRDLVAAEQATRLYPRVTWSRRKSLARRGLIHPVNLANGVGYRFRDLRTMREVDEMLAVGLTLQQAAHRLGPRLRGQLEFRFPMVSVKPRPRRIDLSDEPESAEAWFDVGFCADRDRSSFPTAVAAYERALRIDPQHVPSLINLGNIYYELGQFQQARDRYMRACALDADNPRTHFNLANACDEMGDMLGALRSYRHALRLWPGYADAHFNLALVAEKLSAWGLACRHWQRFLDLEAGGEWVAVARSHLEDARQALARARRRGRGRTG